MKTLCRFFLFGLLHLHRRPPEEVPGLRGLGALPSGVADFVASLDENPPYWREKASGEGCDGGVPLSQFRNGPAVYAEMATRSL